MSAARAFLVALALLLAGCGGGLPTTHYYILQPQDLAPGTTMGSAEARGPTVGVETFHVDPPYDQDRIVYRIGASSAEVGFYAYHRWAAPLARMLQAVVASEYGDVAGAAAIEPAAAGRDYDARLRGRVLAFEEIDTPGGTRVRVTVALRLESRDGATLWTETLRQEATVSTRAVVDVVEQMRASFARIIGESRPKLRLALQDLSPQQTPAIHGQMPN